MPQHALLYTWVACAKDILGLAAYYRLAGRPDYADILEDAAKKIMGYEDRGQLFGAHYATLSVALRAQGRYNESTAALVCATALGYPAKRPSHPRHARPALSDTSL